MIDSEINKEKNTATLPSELDYILYKLAESMEKNRNIHIEILRRASKGHISNKAILDTALIFGVMEMLKVYDESAYNNLMSE